MKISPLFSRQVRLAASAILSACAICASMLLSACGGGGGGPVPNPITLYALNLTLSGYADHVGQRTEFYVTDSSNFLWLAAIYDPLPSASLNVICPSSLREQRSYSCSIWSDKNNDGTHQDSPTDPNWVKPIPASGIFSFAHDENFTNFDPATFDRDERTGDFVFNGIGLDGAVGKAFEARVVDTKSGRTIGIYHLGEVLAADFTVTIPDIINASTYRVDFYVDENGNGDYDAPPTDHAWRRTATVSGTGNLVVNFTHDTSYTDIGL